MSSYISNQRIASKDKKLIWETDRREKGFHKSSSNPQKIAMRELKELTLLFLISLFHTPFTSTSDGVLPNGLNVVKFSAMHEFQNLHAISKNKINEFIKGHFYGHYDFDLENTLYFFTAGRYEYRNKGVDMFIEALARLNHRLQASGSKMTVVAFIIMPAATHSYTIEALKGQAVTKQLRDTVEQIQNRIGEKLFERTARYTG